MEEDLKCPLCKTRLEKITHLHGTPCEKWAHPDDGCPLSLVSPGTDCLWTTIEQAMIQFANKMVTRVPITSRASPARPA